ncbi:hypothetical protein ILUMI_19555, partial [Ignelater luminosus]
KETINDIAVAYERPILENVAHSFLMDIPDLGQQSNDILFITDSGPPSPLPSTSSNVLSFKVKALRELIKSKFDHMERLLLTIVGEGTESGKNKNRIEENFPFEEIRVARSGLKN